MDTSEQAAAIELQERKKAYLAGWRAAHPGYMDRWREKNKEHVSEYDKAYRTANHEHHCERMKRWHRENFTHRKAYKKEWERLNPERHRRARQIRANRRYRRHPHEMLKKRMGALLRFALKQKAGRRTEDIIGCSKVFFSSWIESLFLPGMSFENRSKWHLDHVFPVACCGKREDLILLAFNYKNIRPMWKHDNHAKTSTLTGDSLVAAFVCGITEIHLYKEWQADPHLLAMAERLSFKIVRMFSK